MERLIPNKLTGSLDSAYLAQLTEQVNYITVSPAIPSASLQSRPEQPRP